MTDTNVLELQQPDVINDPLTQLIREGATKLLMQAVEAEVQDLLSHFSDQKIEGKQRLVRNGYLPEREIQTGVGPVSVKVPKVRDRMGEGVKFNSSLVPPYLKKTKSVEEFLPWLYLKGLSTGDFSEALRPLLGEEAKGLSPNVISRLKAQWEGERSAWSQRDLSLKHYVYIWADGVYFNSNSRPN